MPIQTMCNWELSHIHAYKFKWLHTHTCHIVGVNHGFQGVIEQRRHLQASARSYIRTEQRRMWSQFNVLRWIIKAQADLSCHFKLSSLCDHRVIMSCVLRSATCQPVVFGVTAALHVSLWFLCSFSPTDVHCCRAKWPQPEYPTETSPLFLHKVGQVLNFCKTKILFFSSKKRMHYLLILYGNK